MARRHLKISFKWSQITLVCLLGPGTTFDTTAMSRFKSFFFRSTLLYNALCVLYSVLYTLYVLYSVLYTLYYVLCVIYSVLYTLYNTLCVLYRQIHCIMYYAVKYFVLCIIQANTLYVLYRQIHCMYYAGKSFYNNRGELN